ncbi:MAG: xylulokinase [Spirochaetaceae bacterium]
MRQNGKDPEVQKNPRSILVMDIGTSALKGGIIDENGRLLDWGKVHFEIRSSGEYRKWNPRRWVEACAQLCAGLDGVEKAAAVVISGNGPSLVPLDEDGEPSAEVLLWIDGRESRKEGTFSFFLPKAAWFAENRREEYKKTRMFLGSPEYLSFVLCGERAAFTPSNEFGRYIWTGEEIDAYGLSRKQFPPLVKTGTVLGGVTGRAADELGLSPGIPVISGGYDFLMALLGSGTVEPGITCDRTGTSEGINCCSKEPVSHPRIRTLPHAVEGYYNAAGILSSTGLIFEWFRRLTGQQHRNYEEMLEDIRRVEGESGPPYFFPSLHRGAVWEFSGGAFTGLEADHGAEEMGRAVVHSIGFGIYNLIETLEQKGCNISSLRVSGGQGKNSVWNQMKSDMTGKCVEIPAIIDAELTGCAVAGYSALDKGDLVETARRLVRIEEVFYPDAALHRLYREQYGEYERICEGMLPAFLTQEGNQP